MVTIPWPQRRGTASAKEQQDSKLAGLEFHGLKLSQSGPEGLSLFLTIEATAAELGEF